MYFNKLSTVNQIKTEYHTLAKLHHPDRGGHKETMQDINGQYQEALARCNGEVSKGFDGKDHTYTYNQEIEQTIIDKISEILSLKLCGTELELVGTWIWVGGETYPHRNALGKVLKMNFSRRHQRWSWHNGPKYRRKNNFSYNEIKKTYGVQEFEPQTEETVKALA